MKLTSLEKTLLDVANTFFLEFEMDEDDFENTTDFKTQLQEEFQNYFSNYYIESGLQREVTPLVQLHPGHHLDEKILDLIAKHAVLKDKSDTPSVSKMFPKFHKAAPEFGMECTLANALLHVALEDTGHKNVRSTLTHGHWVLSRELTDGAIKIYDASSYVLNGNDGDVTGFVHTFQPNEIIGVKEILEPTGINGKHFTIKTKRDIHGTLLFKDTDEEGFSTVKFYAYSEPILMDISIALRNLNKRLEEKLETVPPIPEGFNFKEIKNELGLFDGYDYLFN